MKDIFLILLILVCYGRCTMVLMFMCTMDELAEVDGPLRERKSKEQGKIQKRSGGVARATRQTIQEIGRY